MSAPLSPRVTKAEPLERPELLDPLRLTPSREQDKRDLFTSIGVGSYAVRGSRSVLGRVIGAVIAVATGVFPVSAMAQPETPEPPPKDAAGDKPAQPAPEKPAAAVAAPEETPKPDDKKTPPPDASSKNIDDASRPQASPTPPEPARAPDPAQPPPTGSFQFGSYGRVIAATDARGGPGRDVDIVAHGSRLDESNYVELELRREDTWKVTKAATRIVATLAVGNPIFHYNGEFDVKMAVRNLYIEEKGLISPDLTVWVGSRMYRGDDIYLLDYWPLDNLNTLGAGARYQATERLTLAAHGGVSQPKGIFFKQDVQRPSPVNGFGAYTVNILDRQKFIGSFKATYSSQGQGGGGFKAVGYGEVHALPAGQKETDPGVFASLPGDNGYVLGLQGGLSTRERNIHFNAFLRYARGIAAFGEFSTPFSLSLDQTSSGAHEVLAAMGGNWERGPFGVMVGGYVRSFRNASPDLDYDDVDEVIIALRPHLFFGDVGGIALEYSQQVQQRGILSIPGANPGGVPPAESPVGPAKGVVTRIGFIPFLSPAGRGDFSRPQIRVIYVVSVRSDGARSFYAQDDIFNLRSVEHFFGVGAEWWFNTSNGG